MTEGERGGKSGRERRVGGRVRGRVGGRGGEPTSEEKEEAGDFSRCICPYCQ